MKKFTLLVAMATILFLTGCQNGLTPTNGEAGTLSFNVDDGINSRAIVPEISMGVVKVRITGQSQDHATAKFSFEYDYPAGNPESKEGLIVGAWDIVAEGLNASGTSIGRDSVVTNVWIDRTETVNLTIRPIEGVGNFLMSYTDLLNGMDLSNLPYPDAVRLIGSYTPVDGVAVEFVGEVAVGGSGTTGEIIDNLPVNLQNNLRLFWNLKNDATDSTGIYNGINAGGASFDGESTQFDSGAANERIYINSDLGFDSLDTYTISLDFKLDTYSGSYLVNKYHNTNKISYMICPDENGAIRFQYVRYNNGTLEIASEPVSLGEWHTAVFVIEGRNSKAYLDNEFIGEIIGSGDGLYDYTTGMSIGNYLTYPSTGSLDGNIKNLGIYSIALSEDEVAFLSNYDNPAPILTGEINLPNLDAEWYDLELKLMSGTVPLSDTIHETFRIVESVDTEMEILLTADELYVGAAGFSVEVNMDNEINVDLNLTTVGDIVTVTATTIDAITLENVSAGLTWYLNGEVYAEGVTSVSFDKTTAGYVISGLRNGTNNVTCRARLGDALGNEDITFIVE